MIRTYIFVLVVFFTSFISAEAQQIHYQRSNQSSKSVSKLSFNPTLKPFYHGVASGDPLEDRVVIWTRVTPETETEIEVTWKMATDPQLENIVKSGSTITNANKDFTVKVDVIGLSAGTTYYYNFKALEKFSVTGRTRTTPDNNVDHLRFAVVSCSNYQAGYFTGYKKIAERKDLDAVIHLGDYIYEYGAGEGTYGYDESRADRANVPDTEILNASDYRTRYSLYRLDPDLLAIHQQHPFIAIWDDHESANDAYTDGAENHDDSEGDWETRKLISKQVYFEWMPIREEENFKINRTISYGNLADIINIDARLEGRNKQITDNTAPELYAPERTMLGVPQRNWLLNELKTSTAKWKIIANQVVFSEMNVGWAARPPQTPNDLENMLLDIWDGYPAERDLIIDYLKENNIHNTVILTGDFHCSVAFDVTKRPSIFSPGAPESITYTPETGEGSVAVEFTTPSITSANFDENIGLLASSFLEFQVNKPLATPGNPNPNPHMKYVDLDQHGYLILDVTDEKAQSDWFFSDIFNAETTTETTGESWFSSSGENRLQKSTTVSSEKKIQPELAPLIREQSINPDTSVENENVAVFMLFPNPVENGTDLTIQLGMIKAGEVSISIADTNGKFVKNLYKETVSSGIYKNSFRVSDLATGLYILTIRSQGNEIFRKIVVE